jgi:hypothetical protein
LDTSLKYELNCPETPHIKHQTNKESKELKLLPSNKTHRNQHRNVMEPYLPMQDKSVPSTLFLHYGRNQLIPLVWNQDFFSRKVNNELQYSLAYATKVFENLVIVHQFHSDNGH